MSFSMDVKEELQKHISSSRHCQIAEMASYVIHLAQLLPEKNVLVFHSENEGLIRKVFTLLKKTYNINSVVEESQAIRTIREKSFRIIIKEEEEIKRILQSVKTEFPFADTVNNLLIKNSCCKRAFLRGSFLCMGSMSNPDKSYHLEMVSESKEQLEQLKGIIADFDIACKITKRKKYYVLYLKEGAAIVDLLNIIGAHVSLMNMENVIILKDVRNSLNRRVNCETANIVKSVNAASRQIEDIRFLEKNYGFHKLPESLRQIAEVRLENPETPLKELGELLVPPIGKSGVNHRLRRLSELADKLRGGEKE